MDNETTQSLLLHLFCVRSEVLGARTQLATAVRRMTQQPDAEKYRFATDVAVATAVLASCQKMYTSLRSTLVDVGIQIPAALELPA